MGNNDFSKFLTDINKNPYELFIFDFDGTLVEPLEIDWRGLKEELRNLLSEEFHGDLYITGLLYKIRKTQGEEGLKEAFRIIEKYESQAIKKARVKKPIEDFVREISGQGKKLAIFSTNMRKTVERILKRLGLQDRFVLVVTKENVRRYKPDPEGLQLILSKLKVSRSRVVYLGDSIVKDLAAGKKAGIKTILVE